MELRSSRLPSSPANIDLRELLKNQEGIIRTKTYCHGASSLTGNAAVFYITVGSFTAARVTRIFKIIPLHIKPRLNTG
jgi:hypothetical protein